VIIEVYSDGSSDGKSGGIGGWAFVIVIDGVKTFEYSGSEKSATNNTMECLSASKGLEYALANYPQCEDVTLISDSQCVLRWADRTYQVKKPHLIPYVIKLRKARDAVKAKTRWVRGHSGNEFNELADKLAKAAREQVGLQAVDGFLAGKDLVAPDDGEKQ
jgi:ribonuclease HI